MHSKTADCLPCVAGMCGGTADFGGMLGKSLLFNCAINRWHRALGTGTGSGSLLGIFLHTHPYLCQPSSSPCSLWQM